MNIIEQLRAEIEGKRREIRPTNTEEMKVVGTPTQLEQGWLNALSWMEKVLDTIQGKQKAVEKPELMKRPTDEDLRNSEWNAPRFEDLTQKVKFGREMKGDDMTVWHFPKGIKEKIKEDSLYRVYYRWHDSADSSDSTTFYDVYYIQEI